MKERLRKEITLCMVADDSARLATDEKEIVSSQLPQETIDALAGLAAILKDIRRRLLSEGYVIIDGRFYSPEGKLVYERNNPIQN